MSPDQELLSVGVCTFRRPAMLKRLLEALAGQVSAGAFSLEVVVVDNDAAGSAGPVVEEARRSSALSIVCAVEPEQNIALARNRVLSLARGAYAAFIDDDEFPDAGWIAGLRETARTSAADAVLGPVVPWLPAPPPRWVTKSGVLNRDSFPTGTVITDPRHTRTGNVLLRMATVRAMGLVFDPRFGRTGGEDVDFFTRMLAKGGRIVWCREAVAREEVPEERTRRGYHIRRAFLRGAVVAKRTKPRPADVVKSLAALAGYAVIIPVLAVLGTGRAMTYVVKSCDHLGKLLGYLHIFPVKERVY